MFEKNSKSVEIRGISESKNDCRDKFEILNNLSILERIKSPDKSIEYGLQALELASEINDKKSEIKALSNIARTYAETLKYEEAIEFFQKALRIGTEINDDENNAETLNSLGKIYTSQNKLQNSLECYVFN
jgi:tetratricopeptide (TPR) repeat protein